MVNADRIFWYLLCIAALCLLLSHMNIRDAIFDSPLAADCAINTDWDEIPPSQEMMPVHSYLLELDAASYLPLDLDISTKVIEERLREVLVAALTGCNRDARNSRHHRDLAGGLSSDIGTVIVTAFGVEGVRCLDYSNPRCHRISVTLDIIMKNKEAKVLSVITELSVLFFGGGLVTEKLELAKVYQSIEVVNLSQSPMRGQRTPNPKTLQRSEAEVGGFIRSTVLPPTAPLPTPQPTYLTVVIAPPPTKPPSPPPTYQPGSTFERESEVSVE